MKKRTTKQMRGVSHRKIPRDYKMIDMFSETYISASNMKYCTCCGIFKCKSEFYVIGKKKPYTRQHCADCHDEGTAEVRERLIYDYEHTNRTDISPKVLKRILTERKTRALESYVFDI